MAMQSNEAIIRAWVEQGLNGGDLSLVDTYMAADYRLTAPGIEIVGPEATKGFMTAWPAAFPDVRYELVELVAGDDQVAWHFVITGTHEEEIFGIPATHRPVHVEVMVFSHFADGKWVEDHVVFDQLGMLQQLGVIALPDSGAT